MNCIVTQIEKSLCEDKYANNLRAVKVIEENGHIVLSGNVKTYFMKQMAQVIVMRYEVKLKNQILVDYGEQS